MSIVINNLSFSYDGQPILRNINLTVNTGDKVGIVGASGGGKSTLLKLVSGLYEVQLGDISINSAQSAAHRRRNVAMVMQNAALFPSSIRDNITCGHEMEDAQVYRACEVAQLDKWIAALPHGLDTFVGERGGKVSGGQAQRIAIARAIAKNASVILLDEPTSALDNQTSAAVMAALDRLTEGKTVLHVSHRPETLIRCNRLFKLESGALYAQ